MRRGLLQGITGGVVITVVMFAAAEVLLRVAYAIRNAMVTEIPLPYAIGHSYGPLPPWVDALRILEPDPVLIWKNRASLRRRYMDIFTPARTQEERMSPLRQFFPVLPEGLRGNAVWEISLNAQGFRDEDFPRAKPAAAYRIVCLGDSWTFGANVGQSEAYPQRLRERLRQEFLGAGFEVFNLGVLGYSSFQGLELLKRTALPMKPDLLVIAFGMNDASVAGYRDRDMPTLAAGRGLPARMAEALEMSESYKLLRYLALVWKYVPESMGQRIRTAAKQAAERPDTVNYAELEPWTRVSPVDYERNIREMIARSRDGGAAVVLVFNELWRESPYRPVLEGVARTETVPLVDGSAIVAGARRRIEEELETKLDLRPPKAGRARTDGQIEVVFRVYAGPYPVPLTLYIVGTHPKLGRLVPNKVAVYDDGTHGDQRAGDRVWSYSATFAPGTRVLYVYTNSGRRGKWEGLDVPDVREFTVAGPRSDGKNYAPIAAFGRLHMQADSWHTDAAGYDLIARAVAEAVKREPSVRVYLERTATTAPRRS